MSKKFLLAAALLATVAALLYFYLPRREFTYRVPSFAPDEVLSATVTFKSELKGPLRLECREKNGKRLAVIYNFDYTTFLYRDYIEFFNFEIPPRCFQRGGTNLAILPSHPTRVKEFKINVVEKSADVTVPNTHSIEGYSDKLIYSPGEWMSLKVHSPEKAFTLEFVQLGKRERTVVKAEGVPGYPQNYRKYASLFGADWKTTYRFQIPANWVPGIYAAKLSGSGKEPPFPLLFMVKASQPQTKRIAYWVPSFTWQAYNGWGGASFYRYSIDDNLRKRITYRISRQRPNTSAVPGGEHAHLATSDVALVAWLEQKNYAFDLITDEEVDADPQLLRRYRTVLIGAHSEYWTARMWAGVDGYLASGGKLAVLGGNVAFYKALALGSDRLESRKDASLHPDSEEPGGLWGDCGRPVSSVLGVTYDHHGYRTYHPYAVKNPKHWVFAGLSLSEGDLIGTSPEGGGSGYETDKRDAFTPPETEWLAKGTNPDKGGADMIYLRRKDGGEVFSVGSVAFSRCLEHDAKMSRVLQNVLKRFGN